MITLERDTNIELLRLVAIFMVLVLHADFISLGIPLQADILANPVGSFFKYFLRQRQSVLPTFLF